MKQMRKRLFAGMTGAALCGALLTGLLPLGSLSAAALDYGPLKYKDYGDHVEILSCDKDVTELIIPAEIDGVPVTVIGQDVFRKMTELKKVILPDTVKTILDGAFNGCSGLTELELGNGLETMTHNLFGGQFRECTSLTEVRLPASLQEVCFSAFYGCTALKTVTIENGVKTIATDAFRSCSSLETVIIPDSVESIGSSAFSNCVNLQSVIIGDGVKRINYDAFASCSSLQKVTIGNSVERIDGGVFAGTAITEITLPESVNYIEYRSFICHNLSSVTIENVECVLSSSGTVFWNEQDSHGNYYYNGVIRGYNNSTAQAYAKKYGCKFVSLNDGDIDCDGEIGLVDAVLLARITSGHEQAGITPRGLRHAELDGAEGLSNGDLVILMRILAGWEPQNIYGTGL